MESYAQVIMDGHQRDNPALGAALLRLLALLLPGGEQADWLEEQQGYLADLPTRRARWGWIVRQLLAMPKYAYTVRSEQEREAA